MKFAKIISGCLLIVVGLSFITVQFLFPESSLLYWSGLVFPLITLVGGVFILLFIIGR